jgi:hypothetical protein
VSILLRFLNLGNAALLGFACFMAFAMVQAQAAAGEAPITRAFLSTYIGLFAAMLALFETRVRYTAGCIRRNFGFLFTYTGRACFLVFLGAICFGMLDDDGKAKAPNSYTTCLLAGLATVLNAALNCFIICNHPEFQQMNAPTSHGEDGGAPTAGADPSRMTEAQIAAYLAAHPELKALVGAFTSAALAATSACGSRRTSFVRLCSSDMAASRWTRTCCCCVISGPCLAWSGPTRGAPIASSRTTQQCVSLPAASGRAQSWSTLAARRPQTRPIF